MLEKGDLHAIRAEYRFYGIATQAGVRPSINDHGHHSWMLVPSWFQPILEMDGMGPGDAFLVQATKLMAESAELRDTVLSTYHLAGPKAVIELLEKTWNIPT